MRNPIRLKNFRPRYLPFILVGLVIVALRAVPLEGVVLGLPLIVVGTLLRGWAAGHLVKNDLLTTTGPYVHLRHPLYLGTLLVATGFALLLGGLWSLALLGVVWPWFALHYFPRKDRLEGARLAALYGESFERYRAAVPPLWPRWTARTASPGERASRWQLARYSENNELGTLIAIVLALVLLGVRASWGNA